MERDDKENFFSIFQNTRNWKDPMKLTCTGSGQTKENTALCRKVLNLCIDLWIPEPGSNKGRLQPLSPVVGHSEECIGHCAREDAEIDGSLVWTSRSLLMFISMILRFRVSRKNISSPQNPQHSFQHAYYYFLKHSLKHFFRKCVGFPPFHLVWGIPSPLLWQTAGRCIKKCIMPSML